MKFADVKVGIPYPEKKFLVTEEAVRTYLAAIEDANPLYIEQKLVRLPLLPFLHVGKR